MNEALVEEINSVPIESSVVDSEGTSLEGSITESEGKQPEDVAAVFFRMQAPKFRELLTKMAPYQLRRAILNAVVYPLIDTQYDPETEEERQFAYLVHELMLNKTIMQLAYEQQKVEEGLQKEQEVGTMGTEETKTEGETSNG